MGRKGEAFASTQGLPLLWGKSKGFVPLRVLRECYSSLPAEGQHGQDDLHGTGNELGKQGQGNQEGTQNKDGC